MLISIIKEILDTQEGSLEPANDSRLIIFDPKREMFAWIASIWPQKTLVPLRLFCPSDVRSGEPDWNNDFRSQSDAHTLSYSVFPEDPFEHQKFFPESLRTLMASATTAIKRKLGFWNWPLLVYFSVESGTTEGACRLRPTHEVRRGVALRPFGRDRTECTDDHHLQASEVPAPGRHFARTRPENRFSLEQFVQRPGVLVISRDRKYHEQHDGVNAMLFERLGQIIESLQQDPTKRRKTYIVVDEFPTLAGDKPCPGIIDMFLRLRSLGVVFIIAFQTYASLKRVYKDMADEIISSCRNFVILGSGDPTDAKHAAELIGKIRGFEEQRNSSEMKGYNASETKGTSKTKGRSLSETRAATKHPALGFTPTNTWSINSSETTQLSTTSGSSYSTTAGVTWVWFDREIKSPTDLLRCPLPTNGVHGIAYRVGEPKPWDFAYEWDFINEHVHKTNPFIPEYIPRHDHEEVLEEPTPEELRVLGLEKVAAEENSSLADPGGGQATSRQQRRRGRDRRRRLGRSSRRRTLRRGD